MCRCDFHLHSPFIRREAELQALLTERYISDEHEQPVVCGGVGSAAHLCSRRGVLLSVVTTLPGLP